MDNKTEAIIKDIGIMAGKIRELGDEMTFRAENIEKAVNAWLENYEATLNKMGEDYAKAMDTCTHCYDTGLTTDKSTGPGSEEPCEYCPRGTIEWQEANNLK